MLSLLLDDGNIIDGDGDGDKDVQDDVRGMGGNIPSVASLGSGRWIRQDSKTSKHF